MMDEASRSARKSLDAGMVILRQKLQAQAALTSGNNEDDNEGRSLASRRSMLSYLSSILRRSTSKVASTVAHLIQHYGPEISCLILYTLERHCLRSDACATISESLYGGRQAKLDRSSQDKQQRKLLAVGDRDKTRVALLVALGPYIRHRLLLWYQKLKQQQSASSSQEQSAARLSLLQKLRNLFVWMYPMLHVSLSSMDMIYQWRYLLGHSVFFHPYAQLLGLVVRRVTQEDSLKSQGTTIPAVAASATGAAIPSSTIPTPLTTTTTTTNSSIPPATTSDAPSATSSTMRNAAVWALSSAVILSWISHFRAEYERQRQELIMQQQQEQQQHQNGTLPTNNLNSHLSGNSHHIQANNTTPPPPSSGMQNALPAHLCPLCRQPRMHPTASSSGFVFCYKCLLQHVQDTGKCPVTGRDCREAQLLRLYEPNHSTSTTNNT